jgi:hypothetical protein
VINGLDALRTLVGDGGPPHRVGYLGYLYGKTGHRTEALRAVSELRKRSATDYVPPSPIGNIYVGLNRREDALDEFERHSLSATLGSCGSRCTRYTTRFEATRDSRN